MINIDTDLFHFLRPDWLYALIPLLLICLWLWRLGSQRSAWRKIVSPALWPHLLVDPNQRQQRWPLLLILLTGTLAILAVAGPTWERLPQPVFRNDSALVIVLDLSRSMNAQDMKPSRMQRAHFKLTDIIKARSEGQTALIVYAADAFTVTPLTDDGQTIISQLGALTPDLMPAQGSQIDRALELASKLLRQAGQTQGDILLITDEVKLASGTKAAKETLKQGYRLSILGIGSAAGAPIPQRGSMLKDARGAIVIAKLNVGELQQIAAAGGGRYASISADDSDLAQLAVNEISQLSGGSTKSDDLTAETWKEFGPWLLLPILPLVAFAFRRGVLVVALVFLLPLPQPANAFEWPASWSGKWENLWQTPDQQAQELLQQQQPEAAAEKFTQPAWKGGAQYKAGNFEDALDNYKSLPGAQARYNEGNTLARLGKLKHALKSYDQSLKLKPNDEDTIYNRKLVEDALKKQQEQKKKQPKKDDDQQKKDQQQDKSDKSKQDKSSQDQSDQKEADKKPSDSDQENQQQPKDKPAQQDQSDSNKSGKQKDKKQADKGQPDQDQPQQKKPQQEEAANNDPQDQSADLPPQDSGEPKDSDAKARELDEEERQAREQWLNRIPDDPAGLLKQKFKYQYNQRARKNSGEQTW